MHTGSEIKDIQVFTEGMEVMLSLLAHFEGVKILDLGSGFKVKYKEGEKETDVNLLGQNLMSKIEDYKNETGRDIEVWFEPGKYLVSECGYFIVQANVVKPTPATVFVGVNAGFNQLIRPMFYQSHHEIKNISNPEGTERIYTVVGNLCETDTFCWDRVLPEVREGDYLSFLNAGAYGFEMSMQFNSRVRPAEILYAQQQGQIIRKREVFDDLQRNVVSVID
jgi:diaminopimelate decarboxylase